MQSSVQNLCPHCRQPAVWSENPDRPFCSARCRLIDLGAWIEESYRIPAEPSPEATQDYEENQ